MTDISLILLLLSATLLVAAALTLKSRERRRQREERVQWEQTARLARLAKDMRAPLTSMLNSLSLVNEGQLSEEHRRALEHTQRSAKWLLNLVNNFRDLAAINEQHLHLEPIDFDLRNTVRDLVAMLESQAQEKGLELGCLMGADLPARVHGDPSRLRQVLVNLLSNAIKFTEQGDVAISAAVVSKSEAGWRLRFEVSDTGMGIDPSETKIIFKPFVQGETALARAYGGAGVGLTVTQHLVDLMGGSIGVSENANGGASFWCELPFEPAEEISDFVVEGTLEGCRTLVVGEIMVSRNTIVNTLTSWGMVCHSVEQFDKAVEVLRQGHDDEDPYEVCLVDVSLSFSSRKAFALAQRIREDKDLRDVRIVILTAHGEMGDGREARRLGVQGYLTKPISKQQMKDTLLHVIRRPLTPEGRLVTRHTLQEAGRKRQQRALVVSTNVPMRRQMAAMLSRLGVAPDVASDLNQASKSWSKRPYDLLLLDSSSATAKNLSKELSQIKKKADNGGTSVHSVLLVPEHIDKKVVIRQGFDQVWSDNGDRDSLESKLNHWLEESSEA